MKHRSSPDSERLTKVRTALMLAGGRGLSIKEMVTQEHINDPKDAVYELRWHGFNIRSDDHKTLSGKPFVRYVIES